MTAKTVSREEWLIARKAHLEAEKAFDRNRDKLSAARRALPRVRIEADYRFDTPEGPKSLAGLFGDHSQLVVYHFMYGPDWAAGCVACSYLADHFDGMIPHLAARDTALVAVSRTDLDTIAAYKQRMGWTFDWVSSLWNDFNRYFAVTFTDEQVADGTTTYNYEDATAFPSTEAPGASVFMKDDDGTVYHTYSTCARGLDKLIGTYHVLDMTPKGRDEDGFGFPMTWLRRKDEYGG